MKQKIALNYNANALNPNAFNIPILIKCIWIFFSYGGWSLSTSEGYRRYVSCEFPGDMPAPFKLPTRIGSSSVTKNYRPLQKVWGISSATWPTGWRNPPLTNQTSVVTADLTAGVESHWAAMTSVGKSAAPGLEPRTSKSGVCSSHHYAIQSG